MTPLYKMKKEWNNIKIDNNSKKQTTHNGNS